MMRDRLDELMSDLLDIDYGVKVMQKMTELCMSGCQMEDREEEELLLDFYARYLEELEQELWCCLSKLDKWMVEVMRQEEGER